MPFDVTMPDGTVVRGIPDGTSKADFDAKYQKNVGVHPQEIRQVPVQNDSRGSQLLQGAAGLVNSAKNAIEPLIGKAANAIVPDAYKKAAQPGSEIIAAGLNKAEDVASKSTIPGFEGYRKAVETVRQGMLNPEKTKNPEFARDAKAAWDLIQSAGGVKAMADMGLVTAKGALAVPQLAAKGVKAVGNAGMKAIAPEYMAKKAEVAATLKLPASEILKKQEDIGYALAAKHGGAFSPELSKQWMQDLEDAKSTAYGSKTKDLTDHQIKINKPLDEYMEKFKDNPITSLDGLRGVEKELNEKIAEHIDPVTHSTDAVGKRYLDVRSSLHKMYTSPDKKYLLGDKQGVDSLLKANDLHGKRIKHQQLEEVIRDAGGDAAREREGFRSLYKRAVKTKFWKEPELEELRKLYRKPSAVKKAAKAVLGHFVGHGNVNAAGHLLSEGATDTSDILNTIGK